MRWGDSRGGEAGEHGLGRPQEENVREMSSEEGLFRLHQNIWAPCVRSGEEGNASRRFSGNLRHSWSATPFPLPFQQEYQLWLPLCPGMPSHGRDIVLRKVPPPSCSALPGLALLSTCSRCSFSDPNPYLTNEPGLEHSFFYFSGSLKIWGFVFCFQSLLFWP